MDSFLSFAQILEKKIRKEIEMDTLRTGEKTAVGTPPDPLFPSPSELNLFLAPKHFNRPQKAQIYHRLRTPPKPRPDHIFQPFQAPSYAFFKSHGSDLPRNFSPQELKSAFRRLALRLHPDQGGGSEQFLQLKAAFERLRTVFG